jgi:hypothetical protein
MVYSVCSVYPVYPVKTKGSGQILAGMNAAREVMRDW